MDNLKGLSHREAMGYSIRWMVEKLIKSGFFSIVIIIALFYVIAGFVNYDEGTKKGIDFLKYASYGSFTTATISLLLGLWIFLTLDLLPIKIALSLYGFLAGANTIFLAVKWKQMEAPSIFIFGILLLFLAIAKATSAKNGLQELKTMNIDEGFYNRVFKPVMSTLAKGGPGVLRLELTGRPLNAVLFDDYSIFLKPKKSECIVCAKKDFDISNAKQKRKRYVADLKVGEEKYNGVLMNEEALKQIEAWKSKEN